MRSSILPLHLLELPLCSSPPLSAFARYNDRSHRHRRPTVSSAADRELSSIDRRRRMSLLSSQPQPPKPQHPPSRFVSDDDGRRWRLCAGCAVFNSKNQLLVGERIGRPGSWQAPQGGVDDNADGERSETVVEAAVRELYEEVGLREGTHVFLETTTTGDNAFPPVIKHRYETGGTGSWLEKEGFAGQELNWVIFRCADPVLETDPSSACRLSGFNGEAPEFSAVKWDDLDHAADGVWEKKAAPYRALREAGVSIGKRWDERCAALDLGGRWSRDNERCVGVAGGLVARGVTEGDASARAEEPYVQSWKRRDPATRPLEWTVATYDGDADGVSPPRRVLRYPVGAFKEAYEGASALFGGGEEKEAGGLVGRRCFYLAEGGADDGVAHVVVSSTPLGREESVRYLKDGELCLRRVFTGSGSAERVVSTEVFTRC